jgi:predicted nicotinamide N-methyase
MQPGDPDRVEGHGFCTHCVAIGRNALAVQLAVLECEGCGSTTPTDGKPTAKALCLECDQSVHQSLDMDAHTRLSFDPPVQPKQSELYTLGGVGGLRVQHLDAMESYAGRIWPGSMMLARYCEQRAKEQPDVFRGKRVIELGCGCAAIPSLACWILGAARLLCTDMNEDGLRILDENINSITQQLRERSIGAAASESDAGTSGMTTRRLAFGEDASDLAGEFDLILGSYILYDSDSFIPLVHTLDQLVPATSSTPDRRPLILLTSHEPTRESVFLDALEARGFEWQRIPFSLQTAQLSDELHTSTGTSNIGTGLRSTSILNIQRRGASKSSSVASPPSGSCPVGTHGRPSCGVCHAHAADVTFGRHLPCGCKRGVIDSSSPSPAALPIHSAQVDAPPSSVVAVTPAARLVGMETKLGPESASASSAPPSSHECVPNPIVVPTNPPPDLDGWMDLPAGMDPFTPKNVAAIRTLREMTYVSRMIGTVFRLYRGKICRIDARGSDAAAQKFERGEMDEFTVDGLAHVITDAELLDRLTPEKKPTVQDARQENHRVTNLFIDLVDSCMSERNRYLTLVVCMGVVLMIDDYHQSLRLLQGRDIAFASRCLNGRIADSDPFSDHLFYGRRVE